MRVFTLSSWKTLSEKCSLSVKAHAGWIHWHDVTGLSWNYSSGFVEESIKCNLSIRECRLRCHGCNAAELQDNWKSGRIAANEPPGTFTLVRWQPVECIEISAAPAVKILGNSFRKLCGTQNRCNSIVMVVSDIVLIFITWGWSCVVNNGQ